MLAFAYGAAPLRSSARLRPPRVSVSPPRPRVSVAPPRPPSPSLVPPAPPAPPPLSLRAANRRLAALCRRPNALRHCLRLFEQLQRHNVAPDKYTYSALLTACARARATQCAMRVYEHLRRRRRSVPLDDHLRVCMLSVIARSTRPDVPLALQLFSSATRPSTALCNVLIDVFAAARDAAAARAVHRHMRAAALAPDAYTVSALVRAHLAADGPHRALLALRRMVDAPLPVHPAAFGQIVAAFGRRGQLRRAAALVEEMRRRGVAPTQNTFNILIAACEGRDHREAFRIFERMRATTALTGDRYTYHALIKCALAQRDTARVRELYTCITRSRYQPNQVSYRMALEAAGMGMHLDFVEQVVADVKRNQCQLRMDAMATLVAAYIRCSDLQAALTHFSAFVNRAHGDAEHAFFEHIRYALTRFDAHDVCDSAHTKRVVDQLERSWKRES